MNQMQLQMPRLSPINKILIIVSGALFLLDAILTKGAGFSLASALGLSAAGISKGFIFQFLTYPFIERQLLAVIFNGLLLWFLGSELETQWGRKRYVQFLAAACLSAALVYVLLGFTIFSSTAVFSFPLGGLQGVGAALCLAYAILYPDRSFMFMMIFPMKAKWFCALLIGMELYTGFFSPMGALAWGHLAAMGGAFASLIYFSGSGQKASSKKQFSLKMQKKKGRAHLSLVEEDEKDEQNRPPRYWQ
jgi:membrane associated rhomboid family serine protease